MSNYITNKTKTISNYIKKGAIYTIIGVSLLAASCSYDVMDSWHRLQKRENRQNDVIEREIQEGDEIAKDKDKFKNALEQMLKEIKQAEPDTENEE